MPEQRQTPPAPTQWLAVPTPIAALFKRVPLAVLAPNDLPARSPSSDPNRSLPTLYVFTTEGDALNGRPSFNPSCLKWQTLLKIARVPFATKPSTNHASPSGALPFLLPPPSPTIPSNDLAIAAGDPLLSHALANASPPNVLDDTLSPRQEAYLSLLTSRVRPAFLHALYLEPSNTRLLRKLYVDPSSQNPLVRATLLRQVRQAAEKEVLGTTRRGFVDTDTLYDEARGALSALNTALGELDESTGGGPEAPFFSGTEEAALFDAEVFAYTNTILNQDLGWEDSKLGDMLRGFPLLVGHRDRMAARYFP